MSGIIKCVGHYKVLYKFTSFTLLYIVLACVYCLLLQSCSTLLTNWLTFTQPVRYVHPVDCSRADCVNVAVM